MITADGTDCYAHVKQAGRYRECKRTNSISTTDLVGRMLLLTKDHLYNTNIPEEQLEAFSNQQQVPKSPYTGISKMLPTSGRIVQFSSGREPGRDDRIIYVDGAFDLFHIGHIEFLKKARSMCDYLLVGVHDDQSINRIKGSNWPIMNLYERVLGVLSCRHVDEVIIGAPYSISQEILNYWSQGISLVLHGIETENSPIHPDAQGLDPYRLVKAKGIYKEIETPFR